MPKINKMLHKYDTVAPGFPPSHPIPPPITPKNPQGTKKGYIQETGLSGTKWITGAYSTPI